MIAFPLHSQQRIILHRNRRRGIMYVLVLISALIVATIGLASLQHLRLQSRSAMENSDFIAARTYARAALEIGMLKIRNDPYWRTNFGNGNWLTNQPIGTGTFSLSAVDPIDNDVTKGDNHPIVFTGIGMQGTTVFKTSARLEVGPRVGSCLEVSMISGDDTTVNAANLTSDQSVSSNHDYSASNGAIVNSNVEAFGKIGGATYSKTTVQRTVARDMPDPLHVLDYYLSAGTTIPYTALTLWSSPELLTNTDFEIDTSSWYAKTNCVLLKSSSQQKGGLYSMQVKSRVLSSDVAAQDVPIASVKSGNTYHLSIPIFPSAVGTAKAVLTVTSTGEGVQSFMSPDFTLAKDINGDWYWVDLNADLTPTWTGTLTKATVSIWMSVKNSYYMDKVSMKDVTYSKDDYVIDKQLISPTVNPYGAANAKGIYVINCSGKDVVVGRSRIVGTLVFLNPGGNSSIDDSVVMEAAIYNYPALLTNKKISIKSSAAVLGEAVVGVNFNPPGTPYPFLGGTANATTTESYQSKITGLVYSAEDLNLLNAPNITGVVIVNKKINVSATSLNLNYLNTFLNDPPPGFDIGTITMKVVPGTWQRTVN